MPEKRNFSCRITLRRKEEGGNIEGKSRKRKREKEEKREKGERKNGEKDILRRRVGHALPSISKSRCFSLPLSNDPVGRILKK